jgi:hypothetical protein
MSKSNDKQKQIEHFMQLPQHSLLLNDRESHVLVPFDMWRDMLIKDEKMKEQTKHEVSGIVEQSGNSAYNNEVGGNHYRQLKIQPFKYAMANNFNAGQTLALRYISRYKFKNGIEDLKKAIHCLELLIEEEYGTQKEK